LGGARAHAFELPDKIDLPQDQYFIVRQAYRGWNRLAYLLGVEFGSMVAVAVGHGAAPSARILPCLDSSAFWGRARRYWSGPGARASALSAARK
jgi:hypothetical protein